MYLSRSTQNLFLQDTHKHTNSSLQRVDVCRSASSAQRGRSMCLPKIKSLKYSEKEGWKKGERVRERERREWEEAKHEIEKIGEGMRERGERENKRLKESQMKRDKETITHLCQSW